MNSARPDELKEKNSRLEYIDCAKGLGILLVVIGHHLKESQELIHWIYSFHMPLFFIITGYLLAYRNQIIPIKEALASGAKTLMYPFFTFSFVVIVWWIAFIVVLQAHPEEPLGNILLRTVTTYGYHAMWFLPTLYIAGTVSKTYRHHSRWVLLLGSAAVGCFMSCIIHSKMLFTGGWRYAAMYFGRVFLAVSFIEIGRVMYGIHRKLSNAAEWIVLMGAMIVSLVLCNKNIFVSMAFSRIGNPAVYYLAACAGSVGVFLLGKKISRGYVGTAMSFWGRNSLIVMALHMDVSIEIAWIVLGVTRLGSRFAPHTASVLAIVIELILLFGMIAVINRYGSFLIRLPRRKK